MKIIVLSIILLLLAFMGIAIKLFVKKNGEFTGTCANRSSSHGDRKVECCGACPDKKDNKEASNSH